MLKKMITFACIFAILLTSVPGFNSNAYAAENISNDFVMEVNSITNVVRLASNVPLNNAQADEKKAVEANKSTAAVVKVAAGGAGNAVLRKDGTVWCFGVGKHGELGDGGTKNYSGPVKVKGLRDVVDIDASFGATIALKQDGTVWGWGSQDIGMFGNAYPQMCPKPVQIPGLTDVKAIAAGDGYVVALKKDGTVWWIGADTDSTAVQVKGLRDVKAISSMGYHTAALKKDGTVWCWGANYGGQLGNGTMKKGDLSMSAIPVQVKNLTEVKAISTGDLHTLALKKDGTVWAWGSNSNGQLGDGSAYGDDKPIPVKVKGLEGIEHIGTGFYSSMAVSKNGTVWCWGSNEYGQFGNGTVQRRSRLVKIAGLTDVIDAAGARFQFIVLKKDGSVWVMGTNDIGQLGTGDTKNRYYPAKIAGLDSLEIRVKVNGESIDFDVDPKTVNGSIMVPFRTLFEALGAEVTWNAAANTAEVKKDDTVVTLKRNSTEAFVNGERRILPAPVVSVGGSLLVPVQFVAESLGAKVEWDAASSTVIITADRVPRRFTIDGSLRDWEGIKPIAEDQKGDAVEGGADIIAIYAFKDNKNLYLAARLDGSDPIVDFNIDINNDGKTDYIIFSNCDPGTARVLKAGSANENNETGKVPLVLHDVMELAVPLSYFHNMQNMRVNIEVKHTKNKEECKTYDEIPGWFDVKAK